jgi:hypothetical protein
VTGTGTDLLLIMDVAFFMRLGFQLSLSASVFFLTNKIFSSDFFEGLSSGMG